MGEALPPSNLPLRSTPRDSGGGQKPSSSAKAFTVPLATVERFSGISSGGKPPFVIPRRLPEPRSRRKYGLNGYVAAQARQLFL